MQEHLQEYNLLKEKFTIHAYCDMTPECRKCEVREAPQWRSLLDNGLLDTFPQQWIGLWKLERCYEINKCFRSNGKAHNNRVTVEGGDLYLVLPEVIREGHVWTPSQSRVEAGSNTSTVALRVVGGDEKGSLKSETVKYDHESHETRTREWQRWRAPAVVVNDRPVLSSQRALHINKPVTV
jgi:hypothetical protein